MARIFNISFEYNDVMYNAMITSRSTPFFTEYNLNMLDDELLKLLPGKKIIATEPLELRFLYATAEHNTVLMNEIIKAVIVRLQSVQV